MGVKKLMEDPVSIDTGVSKSNKRKAERRKKKKNLLEKRKEENEKAAAPELMEINKLPSPVEETEEKKLSEDVQPSENASARSYGEFIKSYRRADTLFFKGDQWFHERPRFNANIRVHLDSKAKENLKVLAASIYKRELELFNQYAEKSPNLKFQRQILLTGTIKDKIAAHIKNIDENPLHCLDDLDKLTALIASNKESLIQEIQEGLCQVIREKLLVRNMIADPFEKQDFEGGIGRVVSTDRAKAERVLLLWYFEDQLRAAYRKLLGALQEVMQSGIPSIKMKATRIVLTLLRNHPKQDIQLILQILVNKLGDADKKEIPQHILRTIKNLTAEFPNIKNPLIDTISEFLNRPKQNASGMKMCLLALNDVLLKKHEVMLVQKMTMLYFGFFRASVKTGDIDSKRMAAILRGIRRAIPFLVGAKGVESISFLEEQMETLYKMCHIVKFKIGVQVLQVLYQVTTSLDDDSPLTDRYHRVLYNFMLDRELGRSVSKTAFFGLVFKTMDRMTDDLKTLKAFMARLLIVTANQKPHVVISALYILSELKRDNKAVDFILRGKDEDLKLAELLDVKDESDMDSEAKDAASSVPELNKDEVVDPLTQIKDEDEDSDDEFFADLDVGEDGEAIVVSTKNAKSGSESISLMQRQLVTVVKDEVDRNTEYDPYGRNPKFCGGTYAKLWPLLSLTNHRHPTVCIFARKLLNGEDIEYKGNPVEDFTNMKFLDKFTNKNPKKLSAASLDSRRALGAKSVYMSRGLRSKKFSMQDLRKAKAEEVPPELLFIHGFLNKYEKKPGGNKKIMDQGDENEEEIEELLNSITNQYKGDDEFDDEWEAVNEDMRQKKEDKKAAKKSVKEKKKIKEASDDESGEELSDLDSDEDIDMDETQDIDMDEDQDIDEDLEEDDIDEEISEDESGEEDIKNQASDDEESIKNQASDDEESLENLGSEDEGEYEDMEDSEQSDKESDEGNDNDEEDDDSEEEDMQPGKKRKLMGMFKDRNLTSMMMDAEDYGEMLEKYGSRAPATTQQDFVNTDKTHLKQLAWESKRLQKKNPQRRPASAASGKRKWRK